MQEFIHGSGILLLYFALAASAALILRRLIRIPDELFRKLLHFILQASYILFISAFQTWWISSLFGMLIVAVAYPIFLWMGRYPGFSSFVNERKKGEFKNSLILAFVMLSVCNAVCWGWLGDKYFVLACMYAWGIGDGFAALIGKRYGRHKIKMRFADPHKSLEGSAAMLITSALSVLLVLLIHGHAGPAACIVVPLAGAGIATLTEMVTPNGLDTITCPAAAMLVMIPLMKLLGGFS